MDRNNLVIGVLSITAVVLLVGLFIVIQVQQPAYAAGMSVSGGDYIMTVGKVQSTPTQYPEELLYVIDVPESKLISYGFDYKSKRLHVTTQLDLKNMAAQTGGEPLPGDAAPNQPPSRPGTRPPTGKRPTP